MWARRTHAHHNIYLSVPKAFCLLKLDLMILEFNLIIVQLLLFVYLNMSCGYGTMELYLITAIVVGRGGSR